MEENENRNNKIEMKVKETNQQQVKKRSKVAVVIITVIVVVILILLCVGNLYASKRKYNNIFDMIKHMVTAEKVSGENENQEEIQKNEIAHINAKECINFNSVVDLHVKDCLNFNSDNKITREYCIVPDSDKTEEYGVELYIGFDDVLYLELNNDMLELYDLEVNIEQDKSYEISNINAENIESICVSEYAGWRMGIGNAYPVAIFLMNDGTVEWLDLENAIKNEDFIAEGKIQNVSDVVRIGEAEFKETEDVKNLGILSSTMTTVFGLKEDGKFYDLVDAIADSSNNKVMNLIVKVKTFVEGDSANSLASAVELADNGSCYYNGGNGWYFSGSYEFKNNTLICKFLRFGGDNLTEKDIHLQYHFNIINNDTLEFKKKVGEVGKYYWLDRENEFDLYLKKGDVFKSSVIKQQEAYELLDELYFSAKSVYKENGFEYEEESETLEITYSNGEKGEANAYQITNYDEIVNNTFTQKGKEQYENKNSLGYKNGKAYGRMVAYAMNITYVETRFVEIDIESDTISCTAENIYSDANDSEDETGRILNSQANFVIKLINGKWLVDEYTYED